MRSYVGYRALVVFATVLAHMTGTFAGRSTDSQAADNGKSSFFASRSLSLSFSSCSCTFATCPCSPLSPRSPTTFIHVRAPFVAHPSSSHLVLLLRATSNQLRILTPSLHSTFSQTLRVSFITFYASYSFTFLSLISSLSPFAHLNDCFISCIFFYSCSLIFLFFFILNPFTFLFFLFLEIRSF